MSEKAYLFCLAPGDDVTLQFAVCASSIKEAVQKAGGDQYNPERQSVSISPNLLRPVTPQDPEWEQGRPQGDEEEPLLLYERGGTRIVLPFMGCDAVILYIKEIPLVQ